MSIDYIHRLLDQAGVHQDRELSASARVSILIAERDIAREALEEIDQGSANLGDRDLLRVGDVRRIIRSVSGGTENG
jgi:hypothetical protein